MADGITNNRAGSEVNIHLYYYIKNVENDGWLRFLYEYNNKKYSVFLPQYTKLQRFKTQDTYTLFKVLNGNTQTKITINGKDVNIVLKDNILWLSTANIASRLETNKPNIDNGAKLILRYKENTKATLMFDNNEIEVKFNNPMQEENITCKIFAPDNPHGISDHYYEETKFYRIWFAIEYGNNSRYIHTGSISAGCITVLPKYWEKLYNYLILNDLEKNKRYVGTIQIIREI